MVRGPQSPPSGRPGRLCSCLLPRGFEPSASYSEPGSATDRSIKGGQIRGIKETERGWGELEGLGDSHGTPSYVLGTS